MNSPNNHPVFLGSAIKGSRMRWLAHALIFALLCWSCAAALPSPQTPALPIQAFIDQVLDPLAGQIADEWVEQSKTEYAVNLQLQCQSRVPALLAVQRPEVVLVEC